MKSARRPILLSKQKGVATLLVSIMILIILGLMTLYTNRSIIIEQKTSTNTYKHALALEAAQSGIEHFMGEISDTVDTTNYKKYFDLPSGGITEYSLKTTYDNKSKIKDGYFNANNNSYQHNFNLAGLIIAKSDTLPTAKKEDGTNLAGQIQSYKIYLYSIPPVGSSTKNRFVVVSRGCADSCDYAEAFITTEFTIGQSKICPMDINGKFTGVNGPSLHGITDVAGKPQNSVYNCGLSLGSEPTNTGSGSTADISGCQVGTCTASDKYDPKYNIQSDPNKDNHFKKYFGKTLAEVKALTSTCKISGNTDQTQLNATLAGSCAGKTTVVIEGNFSINASPTPALGVGAAYPKGLTLIVENDLNMGWGTSTFDGFLYVKGNTNSTVGGAMTINGGAAFAGDVTGELSWAVYADANKSKIPGGGGVTATFSNGSWRDF